MDLVGAWRRASSLALDLLFPPHCVGCGREGTFLCSPCMADLPWLLPPYCARCAEPGARPRLCRRCLQAPLAIDGIRAPFRMEDAVREAVHRLKYRNLRALAPTLAWLMADCARDLALPRDLVAPVPLHPSRQWERGYNQAALLARALAKRLDAPYLEALARSRSAPPQARAASAAQRRDNVRGAFRAASDLVRDRRVLLIDDVCTTGATLEAAAVALKTVGAAEVWGLTLARES